MTDPDDKMDTEIADAMSRRADEQAESLCGPYIKRIEVLEQRLDILRGEMQIFVNRYGPGKIINIGTYGRFKELLERTK